MAHSLYAWARVKFLNSFIDPIRRRNTLSRIVEGGAGVLVGVVLVSVLPGGWKLLAVPAGVFVEYLVYEFVLEPCGLAGHYWERGPRDGESFEIG